MSCYDCAHINVCKAYEPEDADCICNQFKNKTDFVEVVRCRKCKYGDVSIISKAKDGQEEIACYCNLKKAVTDVESYCPSGERK